MDKCIKGQLDLDELINDINKQYMREEFNEGNEILVLAPSPPQECHIATFSKDLIDALIDGFSTTFSVSICALEKEKSSGNYSSEVKYVLDVTNQSAYSQLAERINMETNIHAILIQHDFGLYGGELGEYLLDFLYALSKPVYVTFHSVIPRPGDKRRLIVERIVTVAEKTIVMTKKSAMILVEDYNLPESKISIIPQGLHPIKRKEKDSLIEKYGFGNKKIISTFGDLSFNKNIETALEALPKVIEKFPDLIYLISGTTSPELIKNNGKEYLEFLQKKVKDLGLDNHVEFVNRHLSTSELLNLLQLTDIYLFTSKDRDQVVSGVFDFVSVCDCLVVAAALPQTEEMLSEDIGILVDFEDPVQLANALIRLLEDDELRGWMGKNAIYKSKASQWKNVAVKYANVLQRHLPKQKLIFDLPDISLKHVIKLTNRFGILQYGTNELPDIHSGYTLDDNTRALIAMCMHVEFNKDPSVFVLMDKYLSLIESCQSEEGIFFNYVDPDGNKQLQKEGKKSEDSNGRAIWALGTLVAHREYLPANFIIRAELCFHRATYWIKDLESPHAIAFSIKGLYLYNQSHQYRHIRELIFSLADVLVEKYHAASDANWYWFGHYMTYGNSILPEALLYAHLLDRKEKYRTIAKATFDFLLSKTFQGNNIKLISKKGWLHKGNGRMQEGGEQPIDVSDTIQALQLFYQVFEQDGYREKMEISFSWFLGNNHLHQLIYNPLTGGCHDGLEKENVNLNQGAESTISYLMARLSVGKSRKGMALLQELPPFDYLELDNRLMDRKSKLSQRKKS